MTQREDRSITVNAPYSMHPPCIHLCPLVNRWRKALNWMYRFLSNTGYCFLCSLHGYSLRRALASLGQAWNFPPTHGPIGLAGANIDVSLCLWVCLIVDFYIVMNWGSSTSVVSEVIPFVCPVYTVSIFIRPQPSGWIHKSGYHVLGCSPD